MRDFVGEKRLHLNNMNSIYKMLPIQVDVLIIKGDKSVSNANGPSERISDSTDIALTF